MSDPFHGLPRGHYGAILADPPWHFRSRTALQSSNWTSRRDAEKHYTVMGADDIAAMPVRDLAAKDAHLFLWTTGPCLPIAFEVIKAWGFRYSAMGFTWVKLKRSHNANQLRVLPLGATDLHTGLGLTTRKNAEFCLLARRGNAKRISKSIREIILAPVREHSRKPTETRERIEQYCCGPYIELFSRESRTGWTSWGDEAAKLTWPEPGGWAWCEGNMHLRIVRIVLTVAHLDHQPENCSDGNLKALCQACHNRYDAKTRARGIQARAKEKRASGDLFGDRPSMTDRPFGAPL